MASSVIVTISANKAKGVADERVNGDKKSLKNIANLISGIASGSIVGNVDVQTSGAAAVAASATATLTSCATDTITIGKTTFTGTGTPTTSLHFETDGTNDADCAALAAAINAHTDTSKIVKATSSSNVVTITALQAGVIGNYIVLSETGSTIVCTGSGYLTGGAGGAQDEAKSY